MNRRMVKYFKAELVAQSPIKLASGADGMTDSDVLVDASGKPFIPGSTICGVARHHAKALHDGETVKELPYEKYWFGYIVPRQPRGEESLVRFHDAFPMGDVSVSVRDGVRLDEFKTAVSQGKYDYQIVDAGSRFEVRIEVHLDSGEDAEGADGLLSDLANGFQSGDIRIGGKTSRGFGEVRLENMAALEIDLSTPEGVEAYVDFDWERSKFSPFEVKESAGSVYDDPVSVPLRVAYSLMIRDYGSLSKSGHDEKLVDAEMLGCSGGGGEEEPVIPGTSWAGAFRSHMAKILRAARYDELNGTGDTAEQFLCRVFGSVEGGVVRASKIVFGESRVDGSTQLNATRNSVDRFTGGAADRKLFTNRLSYGGDTCLTIKWSKDFRNEDPDRAKRDKRLLKSLVDVCIDDLCDGLLAVGGMTSVGSGIFARREAVQEEEVPQCN